MQPRNSRGVRQAAAILPVLMLLGGYAGSGPDVESVRIPIPIGSDTVSVLQHTSTRPGLTYVNLHDDENTSVGASMAVVRSHGGRLIELQHSGERMLTFRLQGEVHVVDPNRIFTMRGIDSTLSAHGEATEEARSAVSRFSRRLLEAIGLDTLDVVVAVHNNTPDRYSARSYTAGGGFERDARRVHVRADSDPDDFFFVTSVRLYSDLRDAGFNVVMQDNARAADDGSLSVYCAQREIRYVNAEAEHGHSEMQEQMLTFLHENLLPRN